MKLKLKSFQIKAITILFATVSFTTSAYDYYDDNDYYNSCDNFEDTFIMETDLKIPVEVTCEVPQNVLKKEIEYQKYQKTFLRDLRNQISRDILHGEIDSVSDKADKIIKFLEKNAPEGAKPVQSILELEAIQKPAFEALSFIPYVDTIFKIAKTAHNQTSKNTSRKKYRELLAEIKENKHGNDLMKDVIDLYFDELNSKFDSKIVELKNFKDDNPSIIYKSTEFNDCSSAIKELKRQSRVTTALTMKKVSQELLDFGVGRPTANGKKVWIEGLNGKLSKSVSSKLVCMQGLTENGFSKRKSFHAKNLDIKNRFNVVNDYKSDSNSSCKRKWEHDNGMKMSLNGVMIEPTMWNDKINVVSLSMNLSCLKRRFGDSYPKDNGFTDLQQAVQVSLGMESNQSSQGRLTRTINNYYKNENKWQYRNYTKGSLDCNPREHISEIFQFQFDPKNY